MEKVLPVPEVVKSSGVAAAAAGEDGRRKVLWCRRGELEHVLALELEHCQEQHTAHCPLTPSGSLLQISGYLEIFWIFILQLSRKVDCYKKIENLKFRLFVHSRTFDICFSGRIEPREGAERERGGGSPNKIFTLEAGVEKDSPLHLVGGQ